MQIPVSFCNGKVRAERMEVLPDNCSTLSAVKVYYKIPALWGKGRALNRILDEAKNIKVKNCEICSGGWGDYKCETYCLIYLLTPDGGIKYCN